MTIAPKGEMIMKSRIMVNCRKVKIPTMNFWYAENVDFIRVCASMTAPMCSTSIKLTREKATIADAGWHAFTRAHRARVVNLRDHNLATTGAHCGSNEIGPGPRQ